MFLKKFKSPVFFALGIILIFIAISMFVPVAYCLAHQDANWLFFIKSIFIILGISTVFILFNYQKNANLEINLKQAFLLTTLSWVFMAFFSGLPFYFSDNLNLLDSFFESMSGFTATGSTVIVDIESTNKGILLWRAMTQAIGGLGIIVIGMAILPFLNVGGMKLFKTESSDISDKPFAKTKDFAFRITITYVILLLLCASGLHFGGMTIFDSFCHSFTAMSTGGFSTKNASIGHWNSPLIQWILVVFMFLAAIPFVRLSVLSKKTFKTLYKDTQIRTFLKMNIVLWIVLAFAHKGFNGGLTFFESLTDVAFHVTSLITTTGYVTADYLLWGSLIITSFFFITFLGGCTGSTAGGIKTFRIQIMWQVYKNQLVSLYSPNQITPYKYEDKEIDKRLMLSVMNFVSVFVLTCFLSTLILTLLDIDFVTAISASVTTMSNIGPGLGKVGPIYNFAFLPDLAKLTLTANMLLGRLEFFTVIVLLTPGFWKKV